MAAISYHHTVNDLQDLDWSAAGPFARLEWFALLESAGLKPLIAMMSDGDEAIALPLRRSAGGLEVLTNWYAFTWRELQTTGLSDHTMLEALAKDLATQTHRVTFSKLSAEDGTLDRLKHAFHKAGWLIVAEPCDVNHVLEVEGRSYSQFLADRPGQLRTTLKRKAKKVAVSLSTTFDPCRLGRLRSDLRR